MYRFPSLFADVSFLGNMDLDLLVIEAYNKLKLCFSRVIYGFLLFFGPRKVKTANNGGPAPCKKN